MNKIQKIIFNDEFLYCLTLNIKFLNKTKNILILSKNI